MQTFPVGKSVTLMIPFTDYNGDPVTPMGLTLEIQDEEGVVVHGPLTPVFSPDETDLTYEVPASVNAISSPTGLRQVFLVIDSDSGEHTVSTSYLLRSSKVDVPTASFQPLAAAVLVAHSMPGLDTFKEASEAEQTVALLDAYRRISRFGFQINRTYWKDETRVVSWPGEQDALRIVRPEAWPEMTREEYAALPAPFRDALKRAQVIEADRILMGDPIAEKRNAGLLSHSTGEASVMFKSMRPVDLGLHRDTLEALSGFVVIRATTGRA